MNFVKMPYLQLPDTDGITVMWETDAISTSELLVWEAFCPDCGDVQYSPHGDPQLFHGEEGYMHKVEVTGLKSGKDYCYQTISSVSGSKLTSGYLVFRTEANKNDAFSFAVTSETGGATFGGWYPLQQTKKLVESIANERPDFLLFVGDMVWDGNKKQEWDKLMFTPFRDVFCNTPFYHCAGNHENNADYMKQFFATSEKGYYDFTYGCAQFIALDSTQLSDHIKDNEGNYLSIELTQNLTEENPQIRFLIESLKKNNVKWKFVYLHYPPYFSGTWEASVLRPLCRIFEDHGVDMVFTSHAIVYERSHPIRNDSVDYAKGVRYIVVGGAGERPEWFHHKKAWYTAKSRAVPHFVHVSVTSEFIELQAIDCHGALFDSLVVHRYNR